MKILIVDDEEMIRAVLREYIEFEGRALRRPLSGAFRGL